MQEGDREFFRLRNLNTYRQLKLLGKLPLEMQPKSKAASRQRPEQYNTADDSQQVPAKRGPKPAKTSKTKQRITLRPSLIQIDQSLFESTTQQDRSIGSATTQNINQSVFNADQSPMNQRPNLIMPMDNESVQVINKSFPKRESQFVTHSSMSKNY